MFDLRSKFLPAGDQPRAITDLVTGIQSNARDQVLLGVTGSGKTFTMANVIAQTERPALIMAHNKTLAAQLYEEMKEFFPNNAVEYFVSYYDYYQPEAYIAKSDTFIEKDASINEKIDLLRHSATRNLLERKDVIVIASVSCIYGLGSPELYLQMTLKLCKGQHISIDNLCEQLVELQYERRISTIKRGTFRVLGDIFDIFPSHYENRAWRIMLLGDMIEDIFEIDVETIEKIQPLNSISIFANSHYVTPRLTMKQAVVEIQREMEERVRHFRSIGKISEANRIEQRTMFDMEMIEESGSCKGIENYSRYLSGRESGEPPPTLFEYLPENALLFIDESHVTVPQIGGMYNGDRVRKQSLIDYGFRLPCALDNRPMKFDEWDKIRPHTIYVSATPGTFELDATNEKFIEQIIRPTGLVDPPYCIRPIETQIDDIIEEAHKTTEMGNRTLITTLTKKMAEHLAQHMEEIGMKVTYLHSDVKTLERINIIRDLRYGKYDVLIGVNLLREGLDIPECGLVAILDADKEGFLRSTTSIIQTIGRAARNINSKVILYADKKTDSIKKALEETDRRRTIQQEFNQQHGIMPKTVNRIISNAVHDAIDEALGNAPEENNVTIPPEYLNTSIEQIEAKMLKAAEDLRFEEAAQLREILRNRQQD